MDARSLWIFLNIFNVIATGGVALFWSGRETAVRDAAQTAVREIVAGKRARLRASRWRQLRRDRDYARGQKIIATIFSFLGAALIVVAIHWDGEVPLFVVGGTGGFALGWIGWVTLAALDWRWLAEVAALVEKEEEPDGTRR